MNDSLPPELNAQTNDAQDRMVVGKSLENGKRVLPGMQKQTESIRIGKKILKSEVAGKCGKKDWLPKIYGTRKY